MPAAIAYKELSIFQKRDGSIILKKVINTDEIVLNKTNSIQIGYFSKLLSDNNLTDFESLPN